MSDRGPSPRPAGLYRVGLLGLGTVGRAVAEALIDPAWQEVTARRGEPRLELAAVGVRDPGRARGIRLPESVEVTADLLSLAEGEDIDVLVELLGGQEPAGSLVGTALRGHRPVVTANKALIARDGPALERLARATETALRFEAAVAGGIPVLGPLVRDLPAAGIRSVTGILNGTTNHILTAMAAEGATYSDALADAQRLGYAEADPSADVEGFDAAAKLVILARLAFGAWIDSGRVPRSQPPGFTAGITGVTAEAIAAARQQGLSVKLVAHAERGPAAATPRAWVSPAAVPASSPIGATDGVMNIVEIAADRLGRVWFRGPGAGGAATSSAVLADLLAIARGEGSTWGTLPEASSDDGHESGDSSAPDPAAGWEGPWLDLDLPAGPVRYPRLGESTG